MMVKNRFMAIFARRLVLVLTVGIVFAACSKEKTAEHEDSDEHEEEHVEAVVQLSDEQLEEFDIEIGPAEPGNIQVQRRLSGEIVVEPDRLAHITPRFPGIVKEVRKHMGDKVKKGEVLAVIESNQSLALYEVKSLIAGTVTDKHLTLGEVITDDSHTFTITDLSSVWVNLSVYQKDLPHVKIGQKVVISAGPDMPETTGSISYISPLLDEATRTAVARVVLSNPDGSWRPGLFITGVVEVESVQAAIVVPKTALETIDNQTVVFVQTDEGFVPQPVTLGKSSVTHVEILSGLSAGQTYVKKGGFTLKAELAKGSIESGHGH
ncbi:MAG: efflux RND transporter periplasmic adaptor subunit [Calditrichaeota bacterium]|nr:efflux RND transporter periplasmic adaptor subunit [Calditrichota bacterium]